jgi:hypothetical protein
MCWWRAASSADCPNPLAAAGTDGGCRLRGRVLMPGLIDAHVHVYAAGLNFTRIAQSPFSYLAHFAARFMRASLDRGFTTLRDVGGADVGLASALKEGLLNDVPRLFYGGRAISQTGGHGDFRPGDHGCALPSRSHRNRGWRGRGAARRAGRVAARRIAHQADGIRRHRLSHRSAGALPVFGKWISFLRSEASDAAAMFVKSLASGEERLLGVVCNDRQAWSANSESVIAPGPGNSSGGGASWPVWK